MPKLLNPAFIEEVRTLNRRGFNQTQIAEKLKTNQPRISYVMRKHKIAAPIESYATSRRHAQIAAAIDMRIYVHVLSGDGTISIREEKDATPDQLRALADYVDGRREQAAAHVDEAV